jgi:alanyl-tRNA synthetase
LAFFAKKDQKISLCLSLSSDLQNRFDASKLITPMIAKLDGKGGGGKKDFAMGGGVKIDGEKVSDKSLLLPPGTSAVFQIGKRKFARITIS